MEILFISHKYPPTIGGMEKQCFELIQHAETQNKVHKVVHFSEEESKISFFLKLRRRVKKILSDNPSIEVIHLNDGLMGLFSLWLKSYTDIPVVLTFHGLDLVFPNGFYQRKIREKFTNYDGIICVSTATAQEAIKRGFSPEKVFVVANGVDKELANFTSKPKETLHFLHEEFNIDASDKKIITTLGRPVKRKGFSWFLKNVVPELPDNVCVLMIGPLSGPKKKSLWSLLVPKALKDKIELLTGGVNDEAEIRELLRNSNLQGRVIQTGKLPFNRLLSLLSLSDLFVMPNVKMTGDAEGFGLVALEASLCQTVVLASNLEGIPEAIQDGKNGYLLPSEDADVWKNTIIEKLADSEKIVVEGKAFQEFTLAHYGWGKMATEYLEVFEKVKEAN
jgi:glycosyltransferase involved in cell wall biosynthesis